MGAFDKGFRLDEETGKPTLEFSEYMRLAQELTEQIMGLRRDLEARTHVPVPGREGMSPETLDEMADAERALEDIISDWQTNARDKDRYKQRLANLRQLMQEATQKVGIPEMRNTLESLTQKVQFLISHEQMIDKTLRNMPPESFADRDV